MCTRSRIGESDSKKGRRDCLALGRWRRFVMAWRSTEPKARKSMLEPLMRDSRAAPLKSSHSWKVEGRCHDQCAHRCRFGNASAAASAERITWHHERHVPTRVFSRAMAWRAGTGQRTLALLWSWNSVADAVLRTVDVFSQQRCYYQWSGPKQIGGDCERWIKNVTLLLYRGFERDDMLKDVRSNLVWRVGLWGVRRCQFTVGADCSIRYAKQLRELVERLRQAEPINNPRECKGMEPRTKHRETDNSTIGFSSAMASGCIDLYLIHTPFAFKPGGQPGPEGWER